MTREPPRRDTDDQLADTADAAFESLLRRAARVELVDLPMLPRVGTIVGEKYRIEARLGAGGMGAVFRAVHVVTGRSVAVKWMLRSNTQERARRNFLREARAAGRIHHPNVVDLYDLGEVGSCGYLVMELLQGETLRERLRRGPLPLDEAMGVLLPVMRGVAAVHRAGVIHRDLKPENIFLCQSQHGSPCVPKVLDFGISAVTSLDVAGPTYTRDGEVVGTPAYMAPERFQNAHVADAASDVYSLGVILYEALTGSVPFEADSYPGIVLAIVHEQPKAPSQLQPRLPEALNRIVLRAMAKRSEDRYPTVERLIAALEAFPSNGQVSPVPTPSAARRLAVAGLIGAAAVAWLTWGADRGTRTARAPADSVTSIAPASDLTRPTSAASPESTPPAGAAFAVHPPFLSGPECERCLADSCRDENAACHADDQCSTALSFARRSETPLIANREYLTARADGNWLGDHAEASWGKKRESLTGCVRTHCRKACDIGRNFACTGKFEWPASYPDTARIRFRFFSLDDSSLGYAGWDVRACAPGIGCEGPLARTRTDRKGFATLSLDFSKIRPNTGRLAEFDGTIEADGGRNFFAQSVRHSAPQLDLAYTRFYVSTRKELRASHEPRGLPLPNDLVGILEVQAVDCDYWVASGIVLEIWQARPEGLKLCPDCVVMYPDRTGVPDPKLKEFNESSLSQAEVALAPGEVMVIARDTASSRPVSVLTNLEIRAGREHSVLLFPASGDQLAALPKEIVERRVPR